MDRLRGSNISGSSASLLSSSSAAEGSQTGFGFASNTGIQLGTSAFNGSGETYINYMMSRAPSFFDEVCWTGTGSYPFNINHNLGAVPELMIFKKRNTSDDWYVYAQPVTSPNSAWYKNFGLLDGTLAFGADNFSFTTAPTSTVITAASYYADSANTYVAYLFATCAGVSKVGSYTGNGTTQAIACGFTGGARFVLIKCTSATGGWYVYDTARGMTTLTDPYLLLNSTAAESATLGSVTTTTGGFTVNSAILAAINTNAATYIYLAIA
jgi:hypothetical protein